MGLRQNIPPFLADMPQMADLMDAEQAEIDRIERAAEQMLREFSVSQFTEKTAALWEEFLGFTPAPGWEIERRRERVRSRLLSQRRMTLPVFQEIVESMAMSQVEISENADLSTIVIKFIGIYGVTPYLEDVQAEVERIRPYHLKVVYQWVFARHREMLGKTHENLEQYTHEMIRNGEAINND